MEIQVEGVEEVLAMLERVGELPNEARRALTSIAIGAESAIVAQTPVRSGELRLGNVLDVYLSGDKATAEFYNLMPYDIYVDLGTGIRGSASYRPYIPGEKTPSYASYWPGMVGQAFMRRNVAEGIKRLNTEINTLVKRAVSK